MTTGKNGSDVTLTIRARDEATKVMEGAATALNRLFAVQEGGTATAKDLAATLATVTRAAADVNGAAERAEGAYQRQAAALAATTARLAENRTEAALAAAQIERLQRAVVDDRLAGGGGGGAARLTAELRGAKAAATALDTEAAKLGKQIAALDSQVTGATRIVQQLGSTAVAASHQQAELTDAVAARARAHDEVTAAIGRESAAAASAAAAQRTVNERFSPALNRGPATAGGATFSALASQADADARAAAQIRAAIDPAAAAQLRFNAALRDARDLQARGAITAGELAAQTRRLADELRRGTQESRGRVTAAAPFGLRSDQLTNLSFQINDVATQIASGTSVAQTFAQQAGQIVQIFPRVQSAIFAAFASPPILAAAAAVGTVVVALNEAGNQAERLRSFEGLLTANAAGAAYQARELAGTVQTLREYGTSADEAAASLKTFVAAGLPQGQFEDLGRTARDLADVLGIAVPAAAEKLAAGFSGGYDAVVALDKATNAFSQTELDLIRTLFEEGRAQDARTRALGIFSDRMEAAANKARGEWADAFRSLGGAWSGLLGKIGNTSAIDGAKRGLAELANAATFAIRNISGTLQAADIAGEIARLEAAATRTDAIVNRGGDPSGQLGNANRGTRQQIAFLKGELAKLQTFEAMESFGKGAGAPAGDPANSPAAKAEAAALRTLSLQERLERARDRLNAKEAGRLAGEIAAAAVTGDRLKLETARIAAAKEEESVRDRARAKAERDRKEAERLAKQTRFIDPVAGRVSSDFGPRKSPGGVGSTFHRGTDYAVPVGTSVRAPAAGVVVETGYDSKLGKYILIDHGGKTQSKFGHLSDNRIAEGTAVSQGQVIGKSGNTGSATTGAHLHYTVLVNGKPVDPRKGVFPTDGASRFQVDQGEALADYEETREKLAERSAQRQAALNLAIKQETDERERQIATLTVAEGLEGAALIRAEREAEIARAEFDLRQRVEDANRSLKPGETAASVTAADVSRVRELAAAEFDLANARRLAQAETAAVLQPVEDLEGQRDALRSRIAFLRENGQGEAADGLAPALDAVNEQLRAAIDLATAFHEALNPDTDALGRTRSEIDATVLGLQTARDEAVEWATVLGVSTKEVATAFANTLTGGIDRFARAVGEGANVFRAAKGAFLDFATGFLSGIARMIQQQIALNIVAAIGRALGVSLGAPVGATGGGLGGFASGALPPGVVPFAHDGGVVGAGLPSKAAPLAWFQHAVRYHRGGIAGLRPDEVPTILQRGEEILTRGDTRHRANGGGAGGSNPGGVTVVNTFDPADALERALRSPQGEKVLFNFVRENPEAFKASIG